MLLGTPNESLLLSMVAADGRTDLFGRARVYDSLGSLSATVSLSHVAEGLYQAQYTPVTEGCYSVVYEFFFDSGHSVSAGYEKQGEVLDVNSLRTNVLRILGLVHENSVVDQQAYDTDQNLTGARIRVYDNATNAAAAAAVSPSGYMPGLLFIYQVSASYSGGQLNKYYLTRQQ